LDVGIDKNSVALQVRFELQRDLPTYFQEQGRGSRCPGEPSTCILYGDLGSYVYLRIQLFAVGNDVEDDVTSSTPGGNGYNSAISPWKQGQASPKKKNYPLSIMARRTLCLRTQTKFHEVIRTSVSTLAVSRLGVNFIYQRVLSHRREWIMRCATIHVLSAQSVGMSSSSQCIA
jgi:hypothetical protein